MREKKRRKLLKPSAVQRTDYGGRYATLPAAGVVILLRKTRQRQEMNHRDRERRKEEGKEEGVISLLMHWAAAAANGERQLITLPDKSGATRILTRRKNHIKDRRPPNYQTMDKGVNEKRASEEITLIDQPTSPTVKIRAGGLGR